MLALHVPRANAEAARLVLAGAGLLDMGHRITANGGHVEIPLLARPDAATAEILGALGGSLGEMSIAVPRERFRRPVREIREILTLPPELDRLLPTRWEKLGHVLVLKLDDALAPHFHHIAETYASVLGADTVLRDTGGIRGRFREPVTKLLLGDVTETVHTENGIRYWLDAARLMFSSGNVDERIRMAGVCRPGETVVDMFAGIGYFTLPMAVHSSPASIAAYEVNPLAHRYLVRNAEENGVSGTVRPVLADCLEAPGGVADRIVMGYVGTTHVFLPRAMDVLKPEGGTIHYHETCPDRLLPGRPVGRVRLAAERAGRVLVRAETRRIKSYAPGVEHVVVDAVVSGR